MKRKRTTTYNNRPYKRPRLVNRTLVQPSRIPTRSVELKYIDTALTTLTANTVGSYTLLNPIQVGADASERVGRKVTITSIQIRAMIRQPGSEVLSVSEQPSQMVQLLVVYDRQPGAAAPVITDILNAAHPVSPVNMNNRDRFRILVRKTVTIGPWVRSAAVLTASGTQTHLKVFKKCRLDTIYNGTVSTTVTALSTGALWMVWLGNQASGGNNAQIPVSARIRYLDV